MKKFTVTIEAYSNNFERFKPVNKTFTLKADTDGKAMAAARKEIKPFLDAGAKWKTRICEIK